MRKIYFSLSKKGHIWHHRLKNRAVSFCPVYHFAPVSPTIKKKKKKKNKTSIIFVADTYDGYLL